MANEKQAIAVKVPDQQAARSAGPETFHLLIALVRKVDGGMQSHEAQDLRFLLYQDIDRLQALLLGPTASVEVVQDKVR